MDYSNEKIKDIVLLLVIVAVSLLAPLLVGFIINVIDLDILDELFIKGFVVIPLSIGCGIYLTGKVLGGKINQPRINFISLTSAVMFLVCFILIASYSGIYDILVLRSYGELFSIILFGFIASMSVKLAVDRFLGDAVVPQVRNAAYADDAKNIFEIRDRLPYYFLGTLITLWALFGIVFSISIGYGDTPDILALIYFATNIFAVFFGAYLIYRRYNISIIASYFIINGILFVISFWLLVLEFGRFGP